jgi:NADH-quinone oxidoreductase subunit D
VREPSFISLQSIGPLIEGGMVGDAIVAIASLDPVMGGCDR